MAHLIDTSVWISFLRGENHPRVKLLEALLEEGEAHICEVGFAEICFGARGQFKKYSEYFSSLPFLRLPEKWHLPIASMGHTLREKGFHPFLADLLIAFTALQHQAVLLTSDKDFIPYQQLFGLVLE